MHLALPTYCPRLGAAQERIHSFSIPSHALSSMPSYDSVNSPSLRKMEANRRDTYSSRKRFDMGNIAGDPFALATISIGIVCLSPNRTHCQNSRADMTPIHRLPGSSHSSAPSFQKSKVVSQTTRGGPLSMPCSAYWVSSSPSPLTQSTHTTSL